MFSTARLLRLCVCGVFLACGHISATAAGASDPTRETVSSLDPRGPTDGRAAVGTRLSPDPHVTVDFINSLNSWVVPRFRRFASEASDLQRAIDSSCTGANVGTRSMLRAQRTWLRAMHSWRELEVVQFGPVLSRRTSRIIDYWPTRPMVIESAVKATASAPLVGAEADDAARRWGAATRGLPALEWFLFPEDGRQPGLLHSAAHCLYARRVALQLNLEAASLRDDWTAFSGRWEHTSDAEVRDALRQALNFMAGSCELLRGKKLQKGVRIVGFGGPESSVYQAYDSLRSGKTRSFMIANFETLAAIILGRESRLTYARGRVRFGLVDLLIATGRGDLAKDLPDKVETAHRSLSLLPLDPRKWTLANTEVAAQSLKDLRAVLETQIGPALGVAVAFSDPDGD